MTLSAREASVSQNDLIRRGVSPEPPGDGKGGFNEALCGIFQVLQPVLVATVFSGPTDETCEKH